jgi:hypothetical protein
MISPFFQCATVQSSKPLCLKEDSTFHGFVFTDSFRSLNAFLICLALCCQP